MRLTVRAEIRTHLPSVQCATKHPVSLITCGRAVDPKVLKLLAELRDPLPICKVDSCCSARCLHFVKSCSRGFLQGCALLLSLLLRIS